LKAKYLIHWLMKWLLISCGFDANSREIIFSAERLGKLYGGCACGEQTPSGCASLELYEGDPQVCFSWDVHKILNYLLHLLACESMRVFITCRSRIGGASL
jgi:hypothetical protein